MIEIPWRMPMGTCKQPVCDYLTYQLNDAPKWLEKLCQTEEGLTVKIRLNQYAEISGIEIDAELSPKKEEYLHGKLMQTGWTPSSVWQSFSNHLGWGVG